jgi:rhodanese-related sulfurtransferase
MNSGNSTSISREVLSIVVLAIVIGLAYNAFASKGLPLIAREPKKEAVPDSLLFPQPNIDSSKPHAVANDTSAWKDIKVIAPLHQRALKNPDSMNVVVAKKEETPVYKTISLQQLQRLLAEHRGVLMDARNAEDYLKGHIKGARSVPAIEVERHFEEFAVLPRDTMVLIYCNNPDCHLGRSLAEFMGVMEFTKLLLYDDGWDGWVKANMPIDSTSTPH